LDLAVWWRGRHSRCRAGGGRLCNFEERPIPQRLTVPTLGLVLNLDGETESQDRCTAVNRVSRQPRATLR
jgi:hypothetical protein